MILESKTMKTFTTTFQSIIDIYMQNSLQSQVGGGLLIFPFDVGAPEPFVGVVKFTEP